MYRGGEAGSPPDIMHDWVRGYGNVKNGHSESHAIERPGEEIDIGAATTSGSRKFGLALCVTHLGSSGIDITGWHFQFPSVSYHCAVRNLIRRPRRNARRRVDSSVATSAYSRYWMNNARADAGK